MFQPSCYEIEILGLFAFVELERFIFKFLKSLYMHFTQVRTETIKENRIFY